MSILTPSYSTVFQPSCDEESPTTSERGPPVVWNQMRATTNTAAAAVAAASSRVPGIAVMGVMLPWTHRTPHQFRGERTGSAAISAVTPKTRRASCGAAERLQLAVVRRVGCRERDHASAWRSMESCSKFLLVKPVATNTSGSLDRTMDTASGRPGQTERHQPWKITRTRSETSSRWWIPKPGSLNSTSGSVCGRVRSRWQVARGGHTPRCAARVGLSQPYL